MFHVTSRTNYLVAASACDEIRARHDPSDDRRWADVHCEGGHRRPTGGTRELRGGRPHRAVPTAAPPQAPHPTPPTQETPVAPLKQGSRAGEQQGARTAPSRARQVFRARAIRERGHIFAGEGAGGEQQLTRARLMSQFALREPKYSACPCLRREVRTPC
jgi:hypothetical protein